VQAQDALSRAQALEDMIRQQQVDELGTSRADAPGLFKAPLPIVGGICSINHILVALK
jgi:hypothetical protein